VLGAVPAAPLNRLARLTDYIEPEERVAACPNQDVVYGGGAMAFDVSRRWCRCRISVTGSGSTRSSTCAPMVCRYWRPTFDDMQCPLLASCTLRNRPQKVAARPTECVLRIYAILSADVPADVEKGGAALLALSR
jgi:hypothetical protein